ncbi:Multidrug resistance-associated protein 1, partial [Podila epicladia]
MDATSPSSWCDTQGWGPWNDNNSMTPCFQNTITLGAPALVASTAFLIRARYLDRHGVAHGLGKTNLIYWPSQLAMVAASLAMGVYFAQSWSLSSLSSVFAAGSLLAAWILAARLNILEWTYEIRSSTLIFTFELYSVLATLMAVYSLYTQDQSNQNSFRTLVYYFSAVSTAFVFEAFPRGSTRIQKQSDANPHDKANIFSRWTFHYLQPIISLGFKRPLVQEDIKDVMPKAMRAQPSYQKLSVNWEAHKRATEHANATASPEQLKEKGPLKPSLLRVIAKTYALEFASMLAVKLFASASQFIFPVLVSEMLKYVESEQEEPVSRGVTLAVGMFLASFVVSFANGQFYKKEIEAGLRIRGGMISMIYRKALVLAPSSRGSIGETTNHMSTDVERWPDNLSWMVHWISVPFEIIVCTVMLYNTMGWSALCGLTCIIISAPIQAWVGEFLETARDAKLGAMDSRIQLMTEVLSNIKIIKLYAYEEGFRSKIQAFRNEELSIMRKSGVVLAVLSLVYTCFPFLMAFISFAVYATIGGLNFTPGVINTQVVFVSMTLFGLLNRPVGCMSLVIEATVSIRVATRRIQKFLLKEELDPNNIEHEHSLPKDPAAPVIVLEDATFAWKMENKTSDETEEDEEDEANESTALLSNSSEQTNEPTLTNVNVEITRGHLTAVVGRVGQGKSSLLSAIIGDMYKRKGRALICGSVAYVPQQAWIVNASVRDNITFGKTFDKERYDYILFASGLLPDLAILAAGDQTEIGERGINLSGGQKQRLSLARAAYQDADIYLLDDPLSAVDAHVDQHLWTHLIGPEGLLKNKTRVIVTHGINHLEQVDHILVIKNGQVSEKGHYKTLMKAKQGFYQLIKEFSVSHRSKKSKKREQKVSESSTPSSSSTSLNGDGSCTVVAEDETEKEKGSGELVEDEEVKDGLVTWKTFVSYCKLMSYYYSGLILVTFVLWQVLQLSVPFWLQYWTATVDSTIHSTSYYLGVYAVLMILYMTVDVYTTFLCTVQAPLYASKALHENLLAKVLRLPMSFFDTTPQGRVLNRFSNDIAGVDEHIPEALLSFVACLFNLVGTLLILCFVTPAFLLAIPVLAVFYLILQAYFLRTSNILRRLDAIARSPLYQHFTETLNGVSSIRVMQLSAQFTDKNDSHANTSSNANYTVLMNNRWLATRIEALSSVAILAAALLIVFSRGVLSPSMCGLALSNMIQITNYAIFSMREYCGLQGQLVSIERLNEYMHKRTEAPAETGV